MKSEAPYSNQKLKRFSEGILSTRLSADFSSYFGKRDLVRVHGSFVQLLALTGGRYGDTLRVLPTFYVVGARPWDEVIPQSVALDSADPGKWRFQNVALDESLADEICERLADESPLSFKDEISDADVSAALQAMSRKNEAESAALFLAFFSMTSGATDVRSDLFLSRKIFMKLNRPLRHDWQQNTVRRLDELESRLSSKNCMEECRKEAEEHAARLKLPKLHWPF